ncbi:MAG: hypothetical protein WB763_24435 [Terriglobia bacterium]
MTRVFRGENKGLRPGCARVGVKRFAGLLIEIFLEGVLLVH